MNPKEQIIYELCSRLDEQVYLPVKEELAGQMVTHSLGSRKEDFKGVIEETVNRIIDEKVKELRDWLEYENSVTCGEVIRKIGKIFGEIQQSKGGSK